MAEVVCAVGIAIYMTMVYHGLRSPAELSPTRIRYTGPSLAILTSRRYLITVATGTAITGMLLEREIFKRDIFADTKTPTSNKVGSVPQFSS